MLLVRDVDTGAIYKLYIVDAHHHIGREEYAQNQPIDAYRFYERLSNLLFSEFRNKTEEEIAREYKLVPVEVLKPEFSSRLFSSIPSWKLGDLGWLVDKTVAFPMTDVYAYDLDVGFKKSNNILSSIITKAPDSARITGFARLDPHDGEKAVVELKRSILELGLRGLKLHPIAQMFVDEIDSDTVISLITTAAKLNAPVIFDARFIATARSILSATRKAKKKLGYNPEDNVPGLKVIIAHCARAFTNEDLFSEILTDPNIYSETSTISGDDIPVFYRLAATNEELNGEMETENTWSTKIIFGTDNPFMKEVQAFEHLKYLMTRDFFEKTNADIMDIQRILAGNILKILPPPRQISNGKETSEKTQDVKLSCTRINGTNELIELYKGIIDGISSGMLDLRGLERFVDDLAVIVSDDAELLLIERAKNLFYLLLYQEKDKEKTYDFAYLFSNNPFKDNNAHMTVNAVRILLSSLKEEIKGKECKRDIHEIKNKMINNN